MSPQRLILGFLAGALSVLIFHQGVIFLIGALGIAPVRAWQFTPNPWGVPTLFNGMFWGGVWGMLFVLIWDRVPARLPGPVIGILLGIAGPAIIGNWILMPLIRGQALFGGFVPSRMLITLIIGASFGLGWALILPLLAKAGKGVLGAK